MKFLPDIQSTCRQLPRFSVKPMQQSDYDIPMARVRVCLEREQGHGLRQGLALVYACLDQRVVCRWAFFLVYIMRLQSGWFAQRPTARVCCCDLLWGSLQSPLVIWWLPSIIFHSLSGTC